MKPSPVSPAGTRPITDLFGCDRHELAAALRPLAPRPFHAAQVFHWMYGRGVADFGAMTNLPLDLRRALAERFRARLPEIRATRASSDGSRKYVLGLEDGAEVEAVYILYGERVTLCLSSQVGCALACRFCRTGTMGLVRHLTPGEIVGQVTVLAREHRLSPGSFRIVFMGMGEPLHNYDNVLRAFRILVDPKGFALPARRITLSTAGLVPGIERLAEEHPRPRLAISLGAARDDLRDDLMPINRKHDLERLLEACRRFPLGPREKITFEYILLKGVNDSAQDARSLARLLRGVKAKVNLIPYNEAEVEGLSTPSVGEATRFRETLGARGIVSTIRWSKGRDIGAACGQLVRPRAAAPGRG
jgi:23S rRNA (adenine2503-C2)-methyltransferase